MKIFKKSITYTLILISLLLLSFTTGNFRTQYSIPMAAWSVTAGDIDMDGDNDIVIGHNYNFNTEWAGASIMINDGNGYFSLYDSVFMNGGQYDILLENLDNDTSNKEILGYSYDFETEMNYLAKVNNFDLSDISFLPLGDDAEVGYKTLGDVNGDEVIDIVVASYSGQCWGILYNDGSGNFSEPEYYSVEGYFPYELSCGDLNDDGRDDIVICGQSTEIFFSYPDGFESLILESGGFKAGVSIVDFDLDGDNDILTFEGLAMGGGITSLIMYENLGDNVFDTIPEFYFQPNSYKFFITDFNNDNLQDILFQLNDHTGFIIYYNQADFQLGNPQFVPLPESNPAEGRRDCYCEDMDGNGYKDIIAVKKLYVTLPDNLEILFNDGNGNFVDDPVTEVQNVVQEEYSTNLTCFPNPFANGTSFQFTMPEPKPAELIIYDIQGRMINRLSIKRTIKGVNEIKWDGFDFSGQACKPGSYIVNLKVEQEVLNKIHIFIL